MKGLLVSDLHYALKQFDWTSSVAQDFDVVILAGDHLDISSAVDARVQITVILSYLKRLSAKTRLLVCSGNHDLDARDDTGEKYAQWMARVRQLGVPTDGDSLTIGDTLFTICPWWDGPQAQSRVGELLARDAAQEKARWVWVYHAPPEASPTSWTGRQHFGDAALAQWIRQYQPDMVLCGHIHQSPFCRDGSWVDRVGRTWVFNPGRQPGPRPTHVIFDTAAQMAGWFSQEGAEQVPLDRALSRPLAAIEQRPDWL